MAAPKNPSPFKSEKPWREAIMRAVKRKQTGADPLALEKLADALVEKGIGGDVSALKEIGDRLDGKPAQALQHQGAAGGNLVVEIVRFTDTAAK